MSSQKYPNVSILQESDLTWMSSSTKISPPHAGTKRQTFSAHMLHRIMHIYSPTCLHDMEYAAIENLNRLPRLRCMTFNILAPSFAVRVPHADWKSRRHLIVEAIHEYKADIICLQEVEESVYNMDIMARHDDDGDITSELENM